MEAFTRFIITNTFNAVVENTQLETEVIFNVEWDRVHLDVDKWTEFKNVFSAIDEEFQRRFKHQNTIQLNSFQVVKIFRV